MKEVSTKGRITRRSAVLVSAGILAGVNTAKAAQDSGKKAGSAKPDAALMTGRIALEEHFAPPDIAEPYAQRFSPGTWRQITQGLEDMGTGRIAEMDRGGVELCVLSLTAPGIQAIANISQAIAVAQRANDYLAEHIAKHPNRLKGFAALPMQDPQVAIREMTRCVKELGFCGALVNGFSQVGEADSAVYYDLPQYRSFWATAQQLDVPVYLHPREPLATRQQIYEGHPWFAASAWGFGVETSTHALRLMGSGLFDEYPKLNVILGHLGEGLPFNIWRVDHRISKAQLGIRTKLPMAQYLRENFYVTTSGNFRTQTLVDAMMEVGADRILYSVDYPYEDMGEATEWFDNAAISESDRLKIARSNAQKLFRL